MEHAKRDALKAYCQVDLRALCTQVAALPRELFDLVCGYLLEEQNQDLVLNRMRETDKKGELHQPPSPFNHNVVGPEFLDELMKMYYERTSFEIDTRRSSQSKGTPLDFKLWSLLASDPLGTACVPAKLIKTVTIHISLYNAAWSDVLATQPFALPTRARKIRDAKSILIIKMDTEWTGSRCNGFGYSPQKGRRLLQRLKRSLIPISEHGVTVKVLYEGNETIIGCDTMPEVYKMLPSILHSR